jgi:uncharacterized RDD family membrane protein YckC
MDHDADNPFAAPGADLSGAIPEPPPGDPVPASPTHRLLAAILGVSLGFALYLGSAIAGQILSEQLGIPARLVPWEPMDYAPGAVFLAAYLPIAGHRLARTGQTLPLRILGLRFARPDGTPVGAWRIGLLHGLPTALLFWLPVLAADTLRAAGPLDGLLRFAGLILLCLNALGARGPSRRTWLDRWVGFTVVKA